MKTVAILCFLALVNFAASSKKKSISAESHWPRYPFFRPPAGYFAEPTLGPVDEGEIDYPLVEGEIENHISRPAKSDYRPTNAFKSPVASALHDFAFEMYTDMAKNWTKGHNGVMSPLSIYTALSMLTLGLGGNSNVQAMRILHADAFGDLHGEMLELSQDLYRQTKDVTLTKANRIYVDASIRLLKRFKYLMKMDYKVTAKRVNFRTRPDRNRERINAFVEKHTQKKITELAPPGSVTQDTRLFIVNALYLKVAWKNSFLRTTTGDFQVSPTETIKTEIMTSGGGSCFHDENEALDSQITRILLKEDLSMIIISPHVAGDFSLLEDNNAKDRIREALESFYKPSYASWPTMCRIHLPKFKIEHTAEELIACLKNMGMTDVFDADHADLSRMTPNHHNLYVSDMRHKATIDVNEKGLEAAAATSIGISARMMPFPVIIKRPFMFIIRDDKTGTTLFTGKLVRPEYK